MARKTKKAAKAKPVEVEKMLGDVVVKPLDRLSKNDWNPNELTAFERASLKHGLQTKGWLKSHALTVWGSDEKGVAKNIIIDGEHRWEVAIELGFKNGPMVVLERITEAEAREWTIALDAKRGKFNKKKLALAASEIAELRGDEDITLLSMDLGIEPETLQGMLGGGDEEQLSDGEEGEGDDSDEIPEAPAIPTTKLGDLVFLGRHRLICGDSLSEEARTRLLDGARIDCVMTDPPYAIYGSSSGIGADIADDKMVMPFFDTMHRVICTMLKEHGHVYVCCDWRSYSAITATARGKLALKNCLVWDKKTPGLGSMYSNGHEWIAFFSRMPPAKAMKSTTVGNQRVVRKPNILRFDRVKGEERLVNAIKPVDMFVEMIGNSTDEGENVCDMFGGSGTTVIACEKLGRNAFVFELEPKECDIIVARWEKFTGKKATRIPRDKVA